MITKNSLDELTKYIRVDSNGRMFIGTYTPQGTFTVNPDTTENIAGYFGSSNTQQTDIVIAQTGYNVVSVQNKLGNLTFSTGASSPERMRIDSSGNVGIGTVPKVITAGYRVLDFANTTIMSGDSGNDSYFVNNAYFDGAWKYKISGKQATRYESVLGTHRWYTAPTGTADGTITWTQVGQIDTSGNMFLGDNPTSYSTTSHKRLNVGSTTAKTAIELSSATTVTDGEVAGFYITNQQSGVTGRGVAAIKGLRGSTNNLGHMAFYTQGGSGLVERMRILADGKVGIGTAPTYDLHLKNATSPIFAITDSTGTTSLYSQSQNGLGIIGTITNHPLSIRTNDTERLRITATGNLIVGGNPASLDYAHHIRKFGLLEGQVAVEIGGTFPVTVNEGGTYGWNGAASVMCVSKNNTTGRSINAGGTINASGADYAEYMSKAKDCGDIAKGDICGINAEGKLTDKWSDSIHFAVKSTNPSYVGGDIWGTEEIVGKKPEEPVRIEDKVLQRLVSEAQPCVIDEEGNMVSEAADAVYETVVVEYGETDEEFADRQSAYEYELTLCMDKLEAERQKVDRIAFSGQVPVNIIDFEVGDYIVPVETTDDGISGVAINEDEITFEQYKKAIGRVIAVEQDGRAKIIVKVI